MIPLEVIPILIRIGNSADLDELLAAQLLNSIGKFDAINRQWQAWDEIIKPMRTDDLVALTKGLTLAESHHSWSGGSVAAVIYVFREIQRRDSTLAYEMANWILPRTSNSWVPFGSHNWSALSVEEYRDAMQRQAERKRDRAANEKAREVRAKAERERRRQSYKDRREQKEETRKKLITELTRLTIEDQLRHLATDTTYALELYPTCLADAATEPILKSLAEETRLALWKRVKERKRGPWKTFNGRLLCTLSFNPSDRLN
jgi:hypothetical protein